MAVDGEDCLLGTDMADGAEGFERMRRLENDLEQEYFEKFLKSKTDNSRKKEP